MAISFKVHEDWHERVRGLRRRTGRACSDRICFLRKTLVRCVARRTRRQCALPEGLSRRGSDETCAPRLITGDKSRYRSLSLAVLWLGFRAMRLPLPVFSFQPTRFGHVVEDFAVAASSLRSEDSEHVLQVV